MCTEVANVGMWHGPGRVPPARDTGCGAGPLKCATIGKTARVTAREICLVDGFWVPGLTVVGNCKALKKIEMTA